MRELTSISESDRISPVNNAWGGIDMRARADEYRQGRWRVRAFGEQIYSIEIRGAWIPLTSREMADHLCREIDISGSNPGFDIEEFKSTRDKTFYMEQAVNSWVNSSTCSLDTLQPRERYAEIFKTYWRGWDIRDITSSHIQNFYLSVKNQTCKTGKPYSPKTLKNMIGELRGLFFFHSDSIVKMPRFPEITVQDPVIRWLTENQQEEVFEFIPSAHRPIFTLQRYTACRPNEARGLLKENVYRDKGIFVLATVYGNTGLKTNTKTKSVRPLSIIPEIEEALKPRDATRFVFTINGHPYSRRTHEKIWVTANRKANEMYGTPVVTMYQGTKHSFGCQRLNQGFNKDEIRAVMGHTDSKTTERYAKYMTSTLENVMRGKVAGRLRGIASAGNDKG
jgi:integrase